MRTLSVACAGLLLGLGLGCRSHTLTPGTYGFTAAEVLRDDCGLSANGAALWDGTLEIYGDRVRMLHYGLADATLVGDFQEDREQFELDGTVGQVTEPVGAQQCLLDQIDLHLTAVTDSAAAFHGTLDVFYEATRPQTCDCKLWVTFTAVRR